MNQALIDPATQQTIQFGGKTLRPDVWAFRRNKFYIWEVQSQSGKIEHKLHEIRRELTKMGYAVEAKYMTLNGRVIDVR